MKVTIHYREEEYLLDLEEGSTMRDALKEMEVPANTVIITKEQEVLLQDHELSEGEKIKLLPVISGG